MEEQKGREPQVTRLHRNLEHAGFMLCKPDRCANLCPTPLRLVQNSKGLL